MNERWACGRSVTSSGDWHYAAQTQLAILFGVLLTVQFAMVILMPFGATKADSIWSHIAEAAGGASLAWPPLLAMWAVFGPQRAAVRLPLTMWLAAAIYLGMVVGLSLVAGENNVHALLAPASWLLTFVALQVPLWMIRALGRRRLARHDQVAATCANLPDPSHRPTSKPASQFSLRGLLGWLLAATVLLTALRALLPEASASHEQPLDMLLYIGSTSLLVAPSALPVIGLAWIVLADGRRLWLRVLLGLLILAAFAAAYGFSESLNEKFFISPKAMLATETGAMLNGLFCLCAVRACGYRLRTKTHATAVEQFSPAPTPRGRLQFGLAVVPLAVIAGGLAWNVPSRLEHWRQAKMLVVCHSVGFRASFADDGRIKHLRYFEEQPITDEVCQRIANLGNLPPLDLRKSSIGDRQLALLAPVSTLTGLNLSGAKITDRGLKQLGQFSQLLSLDLSMTQITDAGVVHLQQLTKLQKLKISVTDISNDGLSALSQLPALEIVDARLTAVTAAGAEKFRRARPQVSVECGACDALLDATGFLDVKRAKHKLNLDDMDDLGVAFGAVKLKRLHAQGKMTENGTTSGVTDQGLVAVCAMQTELENLNLRDSDVTDFGVVFLSMLKKLKRLDLRGSSISENGVERLSHALPDCEILR